MQPPYLLFLGDVGDQLAAKTAHGIREWRPEWCVGQLRLPGCQAAARRWTCLSSGRRGPWPLVRGR
jgi:hypothetical protein